MNTSAFQDPGSRYDLMQHALQAAGVGCWDLDLISGSLWRSPEYDRIWGGTPRLSTTPLDDLFAGIIPEDRASVAEAFDQAPSQGSIALEKRIRRVDDNSIRWIRLTGQTYYRAERLAGITGVIADVTPEHQALERLLHTEKMESLSHMAREVAHDFNNLLMVIGTSLEMLNEQISGERANRLCSTMTHGVERGVTLTRQLMNFSHSPDAHGQVVSLDELIASAWEDLAGTAGDMVTIVMTPAQSMSAYCSDPAQLIMAMNNIIDNAREAMPHGGRVVLSMAVRRIDDASAASFGAGPGDYVGISFADDGTGITPDVVARAFEPLFSTKQNKKGHGFGLSQVYSVASCSGGFATIEESQADHGTTVVIHLPLAKPAQR